MRKITRSLTTTTHVYSDHPNWGLGEIVGWTGSDALDIIFENGKYCQLNYKYYHAKESIELCYVRLSDVSQLVVFLRERSVCHLVHFTHINNLTSIVKQGILPRTSVKEKGIVSDDTRLDGNEEYGCFSLTYPNYLMLYQKRKRNPGQYIILMIDIEALSEIKEEGILFFPGNAARSDLRGKGGHGTAAIEAMFADNILSKDGISIRREEQHLESQYTTDPQAEVQVKVAIPVKYIRTIYVEDNEMKSKVKSLISGADIMIEVNANMFWPEYPLWDDYEKKRKVK